MIAGTRYYIGQSVKLNYKKGAFVTSFHDLCRSL